MRTFNGGIKPIEGEFDLLSAHSNRFHSRTLSAGSVFAGVFFAGMIFGGLFWNHIAVPYSNPENITGPLSRLGFHPLNNQLRFVGFVSFPTILLLVLLVASPNLFHFPDPPHSPKSTADDPRTGNKAIGYAIAGSTALALGFFFSFFNQSFAPSHLDFFHEGETLTPAYNWLTGNGAWLGSFIIHGAFFDIFRTALGWFVFDEVSIGAARVAYGFMDYVTPMFICALIINCYLLVNKTEDAGSALLFLVLTLGTYAFLLSHTIFFTKMHKIVPYVLGMLFLLKAMTESKKWAWFATGFMVPFAFFWSIDAGAFFFALTIIAIIFFVYGAMKDRLSPPGPLKGRRHYSFIIWYACGVIVCSLVVTMTMGRVEIMRMLETTFYWFRYKDFVDSYVYPHPFDYNHGNWLLYQMPLALGAIFLFASVVLHRYLLDRAHRNVACIWLLFGSSGILFSRYAIGRSDWPHVCRGSFFMLMALPVLVWAVLQHSHLVRRAVVTRAFRWVAIAVVMGLGVGKVILTGLNVQTLLDSPNRISRLVRLHDEAFLTKGDVQIYRALKGLKCGEEWMYVYASDPAWYFLLRWPPKTRFFVSWYASGESLQKELISEMERDPPRYILYMTPTAPIDHIRQADRLPFVKQWIDQRYRDYLVQGRWNIRCRRHGTGCKASKGLKGTP